MLLFLFVIVYTYTGTAVGVYVFVLVCFCFCECGICLCTINRRLVYVHYVTLTTALCLLACVLACVLLFLPFIFPATAIKINIRQKAARAKAQAAAARQAELEAKREAEERDASCYVCFGGEHSGGDSIVFCDRCCVAVHSSCYHALDVRMGGRGVKPWSGKGYYFVACLGLDAIDHTSLSRRSYANPLYYYKRNNVCTL